MKRTTLALFICALQLTSLTVRSQDSGESMSKFYILNSPLDFIENLKTKPKKGDQFNLVVLTSSPIDWVKEEHIPTLIKLIYSTDSTRSIKNAISSEMYFNRFSSIGREAQNLIESFRMKIPYPPLNSYGQPDKAKARELEAWWINYKTKKP
jgi:hypothetical protein